MAPDHPPGQDVHHDSKSIDTLTSMETQTRAEVDTKQPPIQLQDQTASDSVTPKQDSTPDAEPEVEKPQPQGPAFDKEAEENYKPKTFKFWSIMFSAFVSMFLIALDRTILSTAIPMITNEFNSLGDIGWYGSAYMLTVSAFMLLFGRVYRFYDIKYTFLSNIVLFEVGSAVCGAAPNSIAFIVGRAIAGIGAAGITTGSMMTLIPMIPLHKRPLFQSMFGMVFGISSVAGPLIGGAFAGGSATWRWCFYMNLPIGGLAVFLLLIFFDSPKKRQQGPPTPLLEQITRLDPLGTFFFIPSMVCLILALQWGGSTYPWSNWRIIVLFVVFGVTFIIFIAIQVLMPKSAQLPMRVIKQRTVYVGATFMFLLSGSMFLSVYYIPLWFQTTKGVSPVKSGIYTIPLVLSIVIGSFGSATVTQRLGYYVPSMIVCACMMAIGSGLLTLFTPHSSSGQWIGFQVLVGFGLGFGMQTVGLAVQATLPKEDVGTGVAINFFCQQLGGAIFVSVGQTILNSRLVARLSGIPGLDPQTIVNTGATDLHKVVPDQYVDTVINAYNYGCTRIFLAAMVLSLVQILPAVSMKWVSIKKKKNGPPGAGPGPEGPASKPEESPTKAQESSSKPEETK